MGGVIEDDSEVEGKSRGPSAQKDVAFCGRQNNFECHWDLCAHASPMRTSKLDASKRFHRRGVGSRDPIVR